MKDLRKTYLPTRKDNPPDKVNYAELLVPYDAKKDKPGDISFDLLRDAISTQTRIMSERLKEFWDVYDVLIANLTTLDAYINGVPAKPGNDLDTEFRNWAGNVRNLKRVDLACGAAMAAVTDKIDAAQDAAGLPNVK